MSAIAQIGSADVELLAGPAPGAIGAPNLVAVCLMRDCAQTLPAFVAHYRQLGVQHLALLDNGSTDGSLDLVRAAPDLSLLRCLAPFGHYKQELRRFLIEAFGRERWCLAVDADELFVLDRLAAPSLAELLAHCERAGYNALVTQLVDMFPAGALGGVTPAGPAGDPATALRLAHGWYDLSAVRRLPYPARANVVGNPEIPLYFGGLRARVFGADPCLTKHALLRYDGSQELYPAGSSHFIDRARLADVSCALLHYKFTPDFGRRVATAVRERQYYDDSREYRCYQAALARAPVLELVGPGARLLADPAELRAAGYLQGTVPTS